MGVSTILQYGGSVGNDIQLIEEYQHSSQSLAGAVSIHVKTYRNETLQDNHLLDV